MHMKKITILMLMSLMLMPVYGQIDEKMLNRRYQDEIRDSLAQVVSARQKDMQRYAEKTLAALPNKEKLYDESYMTVACDLVDTFYADGSMHLDLVYRLSYNCKHLEGYTDDYPLGTYDVDSSNSARAICRLTQSFVEHVLADVFVPGKEVEVTISSSADGTEFGAAVPYDGRFGDFRYCPVVFNGERLRISVDRTTGINNNCQLAYIRAQGVRTYLEENVRALRQTVNTYRYVTHSYSDSANTHYYRRSAVEMRVSDVFAETVQRMQRERMKDEYVDYNIPLTGQKSPNTYVLIIANEKYDAQGLNDVPYALNDGESLHTYCVRALGVPERQVKVLQNATRKEIEEEGIHWLTDLAKAVATKRGDATEPQAEIFVYYAGHAFTDLQGTAYLIPNGIDTKEIEMLGGTPPHCLLKKNTFEKDAARLATQCISMDELCAWFNSKTVPVKNVTVVVDASFNGQGRDGKPIFGPTPQRPASGKKMRKASLRTDAVVLMAAAYDKTAWAFDRHEHGFLTYFLLQEMKLQKDNIFKMNYETLFAEISRKLNKESALQNKWQEAAGIAGGRYKDCWNTIRIKN